MGLAKRQNYNRIKNNSFDEELFEKIRDLYFKLERDGVKKSRIYSVIRNEFTRQGYKPFTVMSLFQTLLMLKDKKKVTTEDKLKAYETGVKISAYIANRKRRYQR